MKYKYNDRLELEHVALKDRQAIYYFHDDVMVLIRETEGFCVADFCLDGTCNNASLFEGHTAYKQAWDLKYSYFKKRSRCY